MPNNNVFLKLEKNAVNHFDNDIHLSCWEV